MNAELDLDAPTNIRLNRKGNPIKDVAHSFAGASSIVRGQVRRVRLGEYDLPNLADHLAHIEAAQAALVDAVAELREAGASWADIGAAAGMTRQAAQQRFGKAAPVEAASVEEIVEEWWNTPQPLYEDQSMRNRLKVMGD